MTKNVKFLIALVLLALLAVDAGLFRMALMTKFDEYDYEKGEQLFERINNGELSPTTDDLINLLRLSNEAQNSLHICLEEQREAILTGAILLLFVIGFYIVVLYLLVRNKKEYNHSVESDRGQ